MQTKSFLPGLVVAILFSHFAASAPLDTVGNRTVLIDLLHPLPPSVQFHDSHAGKVTESGLQILFKPADWPGIYVHAPEDTWDFSGHFGMGFTVHNPSAAPAVICLRVDNDGADGTNHCNNLESEIAPGETKDVCMAFSRNDKEFFWGMRGVPPVDAPLGKGAPLNLKEITGFQIFLAHPAQDTTLALKQVFLFGGSHADYINAHMPFVDAFGQYKHGDWPGKLKEEGDFARRLEEERTLLEATPALAERDSFGGWLAGPQLAGTGWFRTEKIDGKWWLITPEGRLFLSLGINCVGFSEYTFAEQRDAWFEYLPDKNDPIFSQAFTVLHGVHSMADVIGGSGSAFNFYAANMIRKYGKDWKTFGREMAYKRLRAWGFTTIGNWSPPFMLETSPVPFTSSATTGNAPRLQAAEGYWSKICDAYHPEFRESIEPEISAMTAKYSGNPLCIGYFVDNELSWEGVIGGVLASNAEQPARQAFLKQLQEHYKDIQSLNDAWESDFSSWDAIERPSKRTKAFKDDTDSFLYQFALQYFTTVRDILKEKAPNQLYLGCRFSPATEPAVRACAAVADVVTFNIYRRQVTPDRWAGEHDLNKPLLIGEFHFGALDRGLFHTGLVATRDQDDRATHYKNYVRSVLEHPGFVGCHWFQFIDEPLTGRSLDGENYNIGFLTVTDTPYPELVEAAKEIHGKAYEIRFNAGRE
ncbi:MAG TPA: beta-galactosidase [Candidatus Hydrogenedentes bacterium]|nr:beta-galactosidase [Candidatus Hydrogenedentota bacterium]